jgi:hypothetical protein
LRSPERPLPVLVLVLVASLPPLGEIDLHHLERLRPDLLVRVEDAELEPLALDEPANLQPDG